MTKLPLALLSLGAIVFCACSSNNDADSTEPSPQTNTKMKINISTSLNSPSDTRATDYAFEKGDEVGLFVVNHNTNGTAATLMASGNHVNNMRFTYNGTWTPDTPIYWKDNNTQADFYLYYPYTASLSSVTAFPFNINADQSTETAFKAGDFLVGTAKDVAPSEQAVTINAKHIMSQMVVALAAGNGFTDETLAAANVSVKINGIKTQSTIDIATATPTATGSTTSITPLKTDGVYKAMIVPQTVADGNLITINVDGRDFNLAKAFTFVSGKRHKFTVTLSKTSNGINVNISKWDEDGIDNGGTAE